MAKRLRASVSSSQKTTIRFSMLIRSCTHSTPRPAVSLAPEWAASRLSLDKATPPPHQSRILMPNESWSLAATVGVSLPDHPEMFAPAKGASLKDIKELSPVGLRVVCEVWPWNLEPNADRSKLKYGGRELQRRWKDVGVLWLDDIYSEPITLNLKESNP